MFNPNTAIAQSNQALAAIESIVIHYAAQMTLDVKVSDDFLAPVFKRFFEKLKLPLTFRKSDYHFLARLKPSHEIDPEVIEKLDLIQKVAESAVPRR